MYQKLILVGNIGADAKLVTTGDGKPFISFPLAVNRPWLDPSGEWQSETTWFSVSKGGPYVEKQVTAFVKGTRVIVEGRLSPDKSTGRPKLHTNKHGEVVASYDVSAEMVKPFPTSKNGENTGDEQDDLPF